MSDVAGSERAPLGIRLLQALGREPDWSTITAEELVAYRDAENRRRASRLARVITGLPDRGAAIQWREVVLPGRRLRVRVYGPRPGAAAGAPTCRSCSTCTAAGSWARRCRATG